MNKFLIRQLEQWFSTKVGQTILRYELEKIAPLTSRSFGYLSLQIGMPCTDYLINNHARKKLILTTCSDNASFTCQYPYINAIPTEIPLENQSVDLVVIPHALELYDNPELIVKEVHRILINEGRVIVIGFNPLHFYGLRYLYHSPLVSPVPYRQQLSQHKVKEWFKLSGFEVESQPVRFKFSPWFAQKDMVYVLAARKRTFGMHLVGPAITKKKKNPPRTAVITPRETNHAN